MAKKDIRRPGIERFDKILPKAIEEHGPAFTQRYREESVLGHWAEIVGGPIAQSVEAVGIQREALLLHTDMPVWANEIRMQSMEILQRVNNFAGCALVSTIRFVRWRKKRVQLPPEDQETEDRLFRSPALGPALRKVDLTEAEIAAVRASCAGVEQPELKKSLFRLGLTRQKLEKLKKSRGWHPCPDCGRLCPPQRKHCFPCAEKHEEEIRTRIRRLLKEIPWARLGTVKREIPEADARLLGIERTLLVQRLAREVHLEDYGTEKAKILTMLFACVPPEQATEARVKRTLYRLRYDLAKPKEWKPLRRYDYIEWGKKKPPAEAQETSTPQAKDEK